MRHVSHAEMIFERRVGCARPHGNGGGVASGVCACAGSVRVCAVKKRCAVCLRSFIEVTRIVSFQRRDI